MIEVKYGKVVTPEVMEAFIKVASHTGFKPKTAYNISKIRSYMEIMGRKVFNFKKDLALKYGELDANGKPVVTQGEVPGMSRLKIKPEHKDAYDKALSELYEDYYEMRAWPIPFPELETAGLSPEDLYHLADFINEVPEDYDEKEETPVEKAE
jgi:hypothetical protein